MDTAAPPGSAFTPPFILPIAHHYRLRFSPSLPFVGPFPFHSCHRSAAAAGNPGSTADHGFLRQHLWPRCQNYRSPRRRATTSRSELRLHLKSAARTPPSPTLHRSRDHQAPPKTAFPDRLHGLRCLQLGTKRSLAHPFLAATKQPRCTVTVGYFRFSTLTITAASPASRNFSDHYYRLRQLAPSNWPCPFKPPSTTLGLLPRLLQPPRGRLRRRQSSFRRHGHRRCLQRPNLMDFYSINSAPTIREYLTVTGLHSGHRNAAIPDHPSRVNGPSTDTSAPTASSADTTTPPPRAWSASPHPF